MYYIYVYALRPLHICFLDCAERTWAAACLPLTVLFLLHIFFIVLFLPMTKHENAKEKEVHDGQYLLARLTKTLA